MTVTCSGCGVTTTVPFQPTPGRPVYCRECFAKQGGGAPSRGPPRPGGGPGGPPSRFGSRDTFQANPPPARKRMMAQGRKTHFVYDARELLGRGKMPENEVRAFIETVFSRGARQSSEAARAFIQEKRDAGALTKEEADGLERLIEQYSFWR